MTRIKLILLSMVVVAAVSVAASATASATTVETRFVVEKVVVTANTEIEGAVGVAQLNSFIPKVKILIECTENTLVTGVNSVIGATGSSKGEITYKKCVVVQIKEGKRESTGTCKVKEPITFTFNDLLVNGVGGILEDEFSPTTPPTFVVIKIEGTGCVLNGEYKAEGTYLAALGAEGEVEKVEHELIFTSTGSKVTLGKEQASLTNTVKLKLKSGKPWYAG